LLGLNIFSLLSLPFFFNAGKKKYLVKEAN